MDEKKRVSPRRKIRKRYSRYLPMVLFCLAALLLIGSTVGSVQATLTYVSEYYDAHVEMKEIGVSLVENGVTVSYRDYADNGNWSKGTGVLLEHIPEDQFQVGRVYQEELSVKNSGEIEQYVRVQVFKSWQRKNSRGQWVKAPDLAPEMIDLHFTQGTWIVGSSSRERTVLYYPQILAPGQSSVPFTDTLKISSEIMTRVKPAVTEETRDNVIVTTYTYDDVRFVIEAEVDAVQTHNAVDAIKSAWGVDVSMSGNAIASVG